MSDERFIELAKEFLKYSFKDIDFKYEELNREEKYFISEKDFNLFVEKIKE